MRSVPEDNPYASPGPVRDNPPKEDGVGRWDRIPEPWSLRVAVLTACALGVLFLIVGIFQWKLSTKLIGVGTGMIFGSLLTLLLKLGCEVSDREILDKIKKLFGIRRR